MTVTRAWTVVTEATTHRRGVVLSLVAAFAILSLAVRLGVLQGVDVGVRDTLRPDREWGPGQVLVAPLVDGLEPARALAACLVVAVFTAAIRRSWRPLVASSGVLGTVLLVTLVTKVLFARPDPSGGETGVGGSYPSGHVLTLLLAAGVGLLLVRPRPPAALWLLVSFPALAMAWALLVGSVHWFTDVLGGLLLGAIGVAVASSPPVARALHACPPDRSEAP
jgi:membrane-associated phospholipid phosphatase